MEFIVDNLVWFIVGGVVILMTIVGYLAEKTDFASKKYREKVGQESGNKKEKKVKKEKKNADVPVVEQEVMPTNKVGLADIVSKKNEENSTVKEEDLSAPTNGIPDVTVDQNVNPPVNAENILPVNDVLNAPVVGDVAASPSVNEPISPVSEAPATPISEVSAPSIEENVAPISEDLAAPIADVNVAIEPVPTGVVPNDVGAPINENLAAPIVDVNVAVEPVPADVVPNDVVAPINEEVTSVAEPNAAAPIISEAALPINDPLTAPINNNIASEQATDAVSEDLYAPIADNAIATEVVEPTISEETNAPVVQNTNIPLPEVEPVASVPIETVGVQEIVPAPIENINNNVPVMENEINTNIETGIIDEVPVQANTEIVNPTSEIFDVPAQNEAVITPEVELSDFEKIFPEDPIIIDNKNDENTQVVATPETVASPDDIWKF